MGRLFNTDELEDRVNDNRKSHTLAQRLVEDMDIANCSNGKEVSKIYELEDKIVKLLAENEALKSENKVLEEELKRIRENPVLM